MSLLCFREEIASSPASSHPSQQRQTSVMVVRFNLMFIDIRSLSVTIHFFVDCRPIKSQQKMEQFVVVLYLSAEEIVRVKVEKQVQEQWVQEQLSEERHHQEYQQY